MDEPAVATMELSTQEIPVNRNPEKAASSDLALPQRGGDEGGAESPDTGEGGDPAVVDLLEGGQVAGDDARR
jgi:hypothetical protein